MPAPMSTRRLSEFMPHFADMHSSTFCIPGACQGPVQTLYAFSSPKLVLQSTGRLCR